MIIKKAINYLLLMGSLLFALTLVEIGLRIAGFSFHMGCCLRKPALG